MFYKDKLVLVTGGTGFVGTHFVNALIEQGARIRIPVHIRRPISCNPRIEYAIADLTRLEDCRIVSHDVQYVFHAAGSVAAAGMDNPMPAITNNLILTAQMLQGAWMENVERFLVFSSSTGYPEADHPIKEEEMWSGPTYSSYFGYGWMRRYIERLSEFVVSKSKMKIALVRPTATYGQWDDFGLTTSHVIPALIRRAVEKENPYVVWGNGKEVRDFLHVTDLVRGCLLMMEKYATCDPVNIGYGKSFTIEDAVRIILKTANHNNADVVFDTSKPSVIPFRMIDTSKAKRIIGFEPEVSLEDGLRDTVKWYKGRVDNEAR